MESVWRQPNAIPALYISGPGPEPNWPYGKSDLALALQLLLVAIVMPFTIAEGCMETAKCYTRPQAWAQLALL